MTNIGDTILQKACIGNSRNSDAGTGNLNLLHLACHQAFDGELDLCAGRTLELRRNLGCGTLANILVVDTHELITNLQTRQVGWRALIWLGDNHAAAITLHTDSRADTAILTRSHHLEVGHLLLRHILRVRVKIAHHTHSTIRHQLIGTHLIHILQIKLTHHIDHNLHIASQTHIVLGRIDAHSGNHRHRKHHPHTKQYLFHTF